MRITKVLAGVAATGALALIVGGAAPAFASDVPVTANVGTAITMSGFNPSSLDLSGLPGSSPQASLSYNVSSNATTGYNVSVNPGNATGFADGSGDKIPNNKLSVNLGSGGSMFYPDSSVLTAHTKTGVSGGTGDPYTDQYQLNIPTGTPAGSYSQTLTYIASAK